MFTISSKGCNIFWGAGQKVMVTTFCRLSQLFFHRSPDLPLLGVGRSETTFSYLFSVFIVKTKSTKKVVFPSTDNILFHRYINKPAGNLGLYDPAEIHNRHELKAFVKEAMIKLGFHLVFFFLYLYR